ncbi:MAG: CoA-acylating methylmalonate-semialdehyde dehydrogenase [Ilumatobacteraceae bacterium]
MNRISHWVNGAVAAGTSGRSGVIWNPATGEQQASVDLATAAEVDSVVAAAAAAFPAWRATNLSRRAEVMFHLRELIDANRKEIASLVSAEHGKVLSDALGEVARGLENVEFACGIPNLLKGGYSEQASTGIDVYSIKQPLGVVAGITPFNFPSMVPMWMFANALACGNTFVLKPSEKDPSASMFLAELLKQAGLPDGCFNVVNGDKEAVDALLHNPDVRAISFVGSTPIARYIYETGTKNGKRVQALGGAKNHMLVLPDADLDMAADACVSAGYGSAGERCMAISVVLAADSIADALVAKIKDRIPAIKVGPASEDGNEMGPLITGEHRDKVASYVAGAAGEGATVVVDGREGARQDGFFLNPSLLDNVKPGMKTYDDEIFGPVLSVTRVSGYAEGLKLINDNPFGNGTALFTRDGGAARRFEFDVQVGMVGINVPIPVPVSYYSFGGWKASLFGDTHMYGPEGVNFFTRTKVVTSRWPDPSTSTVDLGFPQSR